MFDDDMSEAEWDLTMGPCDFDDEFREEESQDNKNTKKPQLTMKQKAKLKKNRAAHYAAIIRKNKRNNRSPKALIKELEENNGVRKCDVCGEEYSPRIADIKRGWGLCCSKNCATKKRHGSFS